MGTKKKCFFRIIVTDSRSPRDGKFIEKIGYYNPLCNKDKKFFVKEELALNWMFKGAIPSITVKNIFSKIGLLEKFHKIKYKKIILNKKNV